MALLPVSQPPTPYLALISPHLKIPPRHGAVSPSSGFPPSAGTSPPARTHTHRVIGSYRPLSHTLPPSVLPSLPPSPLSPWPTQTLSLTPLSPAGELTTTSLLDRETKSEYILIVRAVDGGVGHNQKTGIATVSAHPSWAPQLLTCHPVCCSLAHLQAAPLGLQALGPAAA